MFRRRVPRPRRPRRGSVVVEFAVSVPIVFLFVFASFEICRLNVIRHSVDNAAYEGARQGMIAGATVSHARNAAAAVLAAVSVRQAEIIVSPSRIDNDTRRITVNIEVPLRPNSWIAPVFFRGKSLAGQCTLSRETLE